MARNGLNISINVSDLTEFAEEFRGKERLFEQNLITNAMEYGMLLEEGSRALAPRDEGNLESSIQFQPLEITPYGVTGSVTANSEYAWRRHEDPYSEGSRDKYDNGLKEEDYYQDGRGRRTREKETWRGEEPGRKYMSRPVDLTESDYDEAMQRVLDDTLRGRRT